MAYVVNTKTSGGSGGSIVANLPNHVVDDVIFIFVSGLNTSTINTPSGWQSVGSLNTTGSARNACFYQRVTSAPVSAPTITYTGTSFRIGGIAVVVRGADVTSATSAFDVLGQTTSGSALSVTSPALTTAAAGEMILLFTSGERSAEDPFFAAGDCIDVEYLNDSTSAHYILGTGYTYTPTTTSPQYTSYIADDAAGGIGIFAIAIKDNGTGDNAGYVKQGTAADLVMMNVASHTNAVTGQVDVTDVSFTPQITSVTNAQSGVTQTTINKTLSVEGVLHKLFPNSMGMGTPVNIGEAGNIVIRGIEFTSTVDLSNSKLTFSATANSTNVESLDDLGRVIGFGDNTNASLFLYDGKNSTVKSTLGVQTYLIDTGSSGFEIDTVGGGSLNWAAVKHVIHAVMPSGYSGYQFYIGPLYKLSTMTMLGGSATLPCTFDECAKAAVGGSLNTVTNQSGQTKGQFYSLQDIQIGDGTTDVYWQSQYQSIEFPQVYNYNRGIVQAQMSAAALTLTVYASAGSTIDLDITTLDMGNYHNFIVSSSSSTSATYSFQNCNVLNGTPTIQALGVGSYAGISFIGCKELTINGFNDSATKTIGAATISNCVDTYAVTVTNQDELEALQDVAFKNNNFSIIITGNHGGQTWSLSGATVTGGTGSYDIEYSGTGTLTIEVDTGSGWVDSRVTETGGGTLTLSAPAVTQGVTFTGLVAGSQVVIYETGTTTEIDRTDSSSTSFAWSETYTTDRDVDYTVMKAGYLPIRGVALALSTSVVPVGIDQSADRSYATSSGLTYGTNTVIDTSLKTIAVSTATTVQNLYSALIEFWIAQSALRNVQFPMLTNGPNSFTARNDWEVTSGSIQYLSRDGLRFTNTAGTITDVWAAILSVGTVTGTAEYQTVSAAAPTDALNSGAVDQLIKIYENGVFDYTNYLVLKAQANGYEEVKSDVVAQYGTLEDQLYVVGLTNPALTDFTTGDPAPTGLTLTNHGATPVTWNSKDFSITITDTGANSGDTIWRWINYNKSLDATFQGEEPFNLFDMVLSTGSAFETQYGTIIGSAGATLKGVRVVDGSGNPHPDFTRFQSDDGTYYTVPVSANINISNLPDDVGGDTHLQIYNVTTDTLIYSSDPAGTGYTDSYTDGDVAYATSGDSVRIRFAHANAGTSFEYGQTIVTATTDGILANGDNFIGVDSVYATNGIDGSTVTKFTYTPVNDQFNLVIDANYTAAEMFAFYCYTLTTTDGIEGAFGAFVAADAGNYKNVTSIASIYLDNETTASKRQTDTARIYRDDGAYPVLDPTTSGFGIDVNWQNVVYVVTAGSGLTAGQASELTAAASGSTFNPSVDELEAGETYAEALRLMRAEAAGKLAVTGTTVTIRDANDTKNRITATVDTNGQRTAVTVDAT